MQPSAPPPSVLLPPNVLRAEMREVSRGRVAARQGSGGPCEPRLLSDRNGTGGLQQLSAPTVYAGEQGPKGPRDVDHIRGKGGQTAGRGTQMPKMPGNFS